MSNIQIRISEKEKKEAKKIFEKLGLDMSTAIKLFLRQSIMRKGVPFLLLTENGFTEEQEDEILKSAEEAKKGKNVSKNLSSKEFIDHLKSL